MKLASRIKKVRQISPIEWELEIDAKTLISFKIDNKIKKILKDLAQKKGMSLSDLIREALKEEIKEIKRLGSGVTISLWIRYDQLREIDELARQKGRDRTDIIHSKIAQYLEKEGIMIG